MGLCFGKKDPPAAVIVPASVHPYRFANGVVLRLFGVELCPQTVQIRIALQHKGLSVDPIWVPPEGLNSTKLDWLAAVCPEGAASFPILQHGTSVVFGSSDDIIDYVESTFREPRLLPDASPGMDVTEWVAYIKETFTPLVNQLLYDPDPFVQEDAAPQLEEAFAKLDRGLWEHGKQGPYFMGQEFSLVDVYLIPFLELLRPLSYFRGIEIRDVHTNLVSYYKRMPYFPSYAPVRIDPDLLEMSVSKAVEEKAPPSLVSLTLLQHRSILWHMERVVELSRELASTKLTADAASPIKAKVSMKIKKLNGEYSKLLELMQEHAQMEERTFFPVLENADKGLTELVHADHARDLPIMNGIREDLKSVMALSQGSYLHNEALVALATRLRVFQESTREHFDEEDRDILPLLETVGFGSKKQDESLESCLIIMESSHGRLLPYLLKGLEDHEIYRYMRLVQKPFRDHVSPPPPLLQHMVKSLQSANDEYETVWKLVQERMPALAKLVPPQQEPEEDELSVHTARISLSGSTLSY